HLLSSQLFIEVNEFAHLLQFEILIECFDAPGQVYITREEKVFEESFLDLSFVIYNILTETALSYSNNHWLRRRVFRFLDGRAETRSLLPQELHVRRLEGDDVK